MSVVQNRTADPGTKWFRGRNAKTKPRSETGDSANDRVGECGGAEHPHPDFGLSSFVRKNMPRMGVIRMHTKWPEPNGSGLLLATIGGVEG